MLDGLAGQAASAAAEPKPALDGERSARRQTTKPTHRFAWDRWPRHLARGATRDVARRRWTISSATCSRTRSAYGACRRSAQPPAPKRAPPRPYRTTPCGIFALLECEADAQPPWATSRRLLPCERSRSAAAARKGMPLAYSESLAGLSRPGARCGANGPAGTIDHAGGAGGRGRDLEGQWVLEYSFGPHAHRLQRAAAPFRPFHAHQHAHYLPQ